VKKRIRIACLLVALLASGTGRGERVLAFSAPAPTVQQQVLVLGFMGGRNRRDDEHFGVGRFAKKLREMDLPCVRVETIENAKRELALELVRQAFDRNGDRQIDSQERESTRLILYGQSFGGAAVVRFARELKAVGIPVMLTVQVDAVGQNDEVIPSNVAAAANLFESDDLFVHGARHIRAEDPQTTVILGNFEFNYRNSAIDLSDLPWHKKVFQESHLRMDRDPAVWSKVEDLILVTLARNGWCTSS
jgi:hypothetical protein